MRTRHPHYWEKPMTETPRYATEVLLEFRTEAPAAARVVEAGGGATAARPTLPRVAAEAATYSKLDAPTLPGRLGYRKSIGVGEEVGSSGASKATLCGLRHGIG